jgi:hypothetical protein
LGKKQLQAARRSEINVITLGLDCSLTPRSLGGQGRRRGGIWALEPAEPHASVPLSRNSKLCQAVPALPNSARAWLLLWGGQEIKSLCDLGSSLPTSPLSSLTQKSLSEPGYPELNFSTRLLFSFPVNSTVKIPDLSVAKIKDFLLFLP